MLLQIKDAEFRYGDVTVFSNVNAEVNEGDSVGLVGGNGEGKSTLLNCLAGQAQLFGGSVFKKNGLTMGYLRQNADFQSDKTLYQEMMSVFSYELDLVAQIRKISEEMSVADFQSESYKRLADRYHRLSLEADAKDAYSCEVRVKTVLNGMGMAAFSDRVVSTLSGGEKTKAALCKMLLIRPELMILDEPTNHLDYKTLDWLEGFLSDRKSSLIVVSHDRYFLDKLCTKIWELKAGEIAVFGGNYTKYKTLRAERDLNRQRAFDKQQKEIAKMQDYIDRNKARASTADMAKSREKAIARMEIVSAPVAEAAPPRFAFSYTTEPSEFPLTVKNLSFGFDGRQLLDGADLQLRRGGKTALLGLNGTGKSTLLRRIAANNPADYGKIIFGKNVRFGYYDQENRDLVADRRVLDQLWFDNTRMSQTEVRSLLAQITLGADDVYKLVGELSGGERAKLGLAMIMAKDCNLLLLDEPTNHLDLPSREALEEALRNYTGTVLFVSHDRYFVNSVASEIAELDGGKIAVHQGNYDDFTSAKPAVKEVAPQVAKGNYRSAKQRAEQTNRANKIKQLEKRITELETEQKLLNDEMALPEVAADYSQLSQVLEQSRRVEEELEKVLAEWEALQEE